MPQDGAAPTKGHKGGEDPEDDKPLVSSEHDSSSDGEELEADDVGVYLMFYTHHFQLQDLHFSLNVCCRCQTRALD